MADFSYETLDVYKTGLEFIAGADKMTKVFAPSRAYIGQQLNERASIVVLSVAKGSSESDRTLRAESFRAARGAAVESAALLDVCRVLKLGDETSLGALRKSLVKIVALLGEQLRSAEAPAPAVPGATKPVAPVPPPVAPAVPPTEEFL
jgi:hypothetical protein